MAIKEGNYQIIPLKNLQNRMVQKEDSDSFDASYFKDVYQQAAELTDIIVRSNENIKLDDESGIPMQETMAIQNVIAFTGRRGTGKTSAMLSFADALASGRYCGGQNDAYAGKYTALKGKTFYAVQYVDASIVSKDEDFFEILLFRMLQYLKQSVEEHNKNGYFKHNAYLSDLKERIAKLYDHYSSIHQNTQINYSSSYSLLEKNIEKHDVRKDIIRLMREYLRFLNLLPWGNRNGSDDNGYLVICIDDIDMAGNKHLEILQCIYQCFMIPRVIVMITLNVPVISATVRKEFYSTMSIPDSSEQGRISHFSQEQTNDYIRKIIPSDMRITMPSWRKIDYRNLSPTLVRLSDIGEKEAAKKIFPNLANCKWYLNETDDMSPKELIMLLLADRTKICLDVAGLKLHFMEPDSLRNFYDLFYLLYHMKVVHPVDEKKEGLSEEGKDAAKKKYYEELEYNRRILLNYLYFKMIPEFHFDHSLEMELKGFQAEPMDRRGKRIWDYYYKKFLDSNNSQKIEMLYSNEFFKDEKERYKIKNYSFGELFRCLYNASRLDLLDKDFVKVVLASFAFTLPQYIEVQKKEYNERKEKAEKEGKEFEFSFSQLRDVFGYTFLGTWCRDLYKDSTPTNNPNDSTSDSKKDRRVYIKIDSKQFKKKLEDEGKKAIEHLINLLLLSTKSVKDKFEVISENEKEYIYIDADLDPTAFIIGSVRASRLKHIRFSDDKNTDMTLSELLLNGIYNNNNNETSDELINEEIDKQSDKTIDEPIENATKTINDMVNNAINQIVGYPKHLIWFLLKHTDITYNVIKRTISYFIYYSDANLQVRTVGLKTPSEIFKKFYLLFLEKLGEEIKTYRATLGLSEYMSEVEPVIEESNGDKMDLCLELYKLTDKERVTLATYKTDQDESKSILPIINYFVSSEELLNEYGLGIDWYEKKKS